MMRRKAYLPALALTAAAMLGGCVSSTRNAQVHPPASLSAKSAKLAPLPIQRKFPEVDLSAMRPGIDVLIDKVETAYRKGETDYRAGRMEQARQDFDRAVNLMLASGLNFNSDPRLEPLMDRIIDTVHAYQQTAEQEGQTEALEAPEQEAPPMEEIGDLSSLPAASPELRLRIAPELLTVPHDLPLTLNDQVLSYLSFFMTSRGRKIVENGLRRAGRYREMIEKTLHKEGLPRDLFYLAQAESSFQPQAISRSGARGLWQFMPLRAREYGLTINRQVDERMDPSRSTLAAAQHLRDLYAIFGDWYLAMAAYNAGPLNVARAIERTGYADFWKLDQMNALPRETKSYIPIIVALALIGKDPALYGIQTQPDPPLLVDRFQPDHPLDLRLAADAIGTSLEDLRSLNPELIGVVTPDDPGFALNLPKGTAEKLRGELSRIPADKWVGWRLHQVESGDTLATLGRKFHVKPASLASANDIEPDAALDPGQKLLVPAPQPRVQWVRYRVRRDDTLWSIAHRYRTSVSELREANPRLAHHPLHVGVLIFIRHPVGEAYRWRRRRVAHETHRGRGQPTHSDYHRVRRGETLWSIAQANHTSVSALREANPELGHRALRAGDRISIPE
jgi:peptidoglycan lytic transglycosylase D